jgi:hypothetical protein
VTGRTSQNDHFSSRVGLQEIVSPRSVPTVGKRSTDFAGWAGVAVHRPLVAVSRPQFKDPQAWKPAHLSRALVVALRGEFRKRFPKVKNCASPDDSVERPWRYRDSDIRITKAYSSTDHWAVAETTLHEYRCDGLLDDGSAFDVHWFVIGPGGAIRTLGAGMWLVDSGDYDGDGRSELLFSIDGYNLGGYRLYYDELKKSVEFAFHYH